MPHGEKEIETEMPKVIGDSTISVSQRYLPIMEVALPDVDVVGKVNTCSLPLTTLMVMAESIEGLLKRNPFTTG